MLAFISSLNRNSYFFYIVEIVFQDGLGNYVNFDNELYTKYFDEDNGKIYLTPWGNSVFYHTWTMDWLSFTKWRIL